MSLTKVTRSDPYEFPKSIVPLGLTYQWCTKTVAGEPQEQYKKLLADGWVAVPSKWHPEYFDMPGAVEIGPSVLMCHPRARDEEFDRITGAENNIENWMAQNGGFSGGVRMIMQDANGTQEVTRRIGDARLSKQILPRPMVAESIYDSPITATKKTRAARFIWLRPLFSLISKEV